jgi:23S rRNA pseudouridine2605 synthase
MPRPAEIPPVGAPAGDRIAKLLARAGVASRREVERMITDGRVALNGVVLDTPATVLPSLDGVTVDGEPVARPEPARLFLYHKPTGLLVTEHDPRGRPTIYDRLYKGGVGDLPRLVPVGRLDLNTEGLLLLTTDGGLKRELELPATGVERSYRARAYGPVTQAQLEDLMEGVEIEGVRYGPINANLERRTGANTWIELTLTEGKNREVRRVLEHLGLQVGRLIRTRYGPFVLGDLPAGAIGEVRQADLTAFRQTLTTAAKNEGRIAVTSAGSAPPGQGSRRPARGAGGSADRRPAPAALPRSAPVRRSVSPQQPHTDAHPGEGRAPVATRSTVKPRTPPRAADPAQAGEQRSAPSPTGKPFKQRGAAPSRDASQLDPGLRPGRAPTKSRPGHKARISPAPGAAPADAGPRHSDLKRAANSFSRGESEGAAKPRKVEGEGHSQRQPTEATPRPAKPQPKIGWAKPKPKAGPPRRPGKPK